ncbi:hypothetical protein D3C87_2044910 [compost metagenome]
MGDNHCVAGQRLGKVEQAHGNIVIVLAAVRAELPIALIPLAGRQRSVFPRNLGM